MIEQKHVLLETTNKEADENFQENTIKETITTVFPPNSNRLECKATQVDAMNNEIESRYLLWVFGFYVIQLKYKYCSAP